MLSRFTPVGHGKFPGNQEIKTAIYEWQLPNPNQFGDLKMRFVVPQDGPPRHFYSEPHLQSFDKDLEAETRFLESACACGYRLLHDLEGHRETETLAYGMYAAVFRNRHAGHVGIARAFSSPQDYVDFSAVNGQPSLITPGLDAALINPVADLQLGTKVDFFLHRSVRARVMLQKALRAADCGDIRNVLEYYQKSYFDFDQVRPTDAAGSRFTLCIDKLPHRSELDLMFTEGIAGSSASFNWCDTMEAVRQSVIGGSCSATDFARIDDESYLACVATVLKSYRKRTPREFDKWLRNVREHGFLGLIKGATRLKGEEREFAAALGHRMFSLLLWDSYQHMARCYGVLMELIWLHLELDEEMKVTPLESKIFRSFHLPQMYLGGLPLAFLTHHQLRWICNPLQRLRSEGEFGRESHEPLNKLLGLYGLLVRERRSADRRSKEYKGKLAELNQSHSVQDDEICLTARPWEGEKDCPRCGQRLSDERVIKSETSRLVFAATCCQCEREYAFYCDPKELEESACQI